MTRRLQDAKSDWFPQARDAFADRYGDAHPRAAEVLGDDWDRLTAFHDFPGGALAADRPKL